MKHVVVVCTATTTMVHAYPSQAYQMFPPARKCRLSLLEVAASMLILHCGGHAMQICSTDVPCLISVMNSRSVQVTDTEIRASLDNVAESLGITTLHRAPALARRVHASAQVKYYKASRKPG